ERLRVARLAHVVGDVEELDAPEPEQPRAVRVTLAVGERVVLAMHRHPLLPALPRGDPQRDAEGDVRHGVDSQRPVGQCAMQVDGRRNDGHLGDRDADEQHRPCPGHAEALVWITVMVWVLDLVGTPGRARLAPRSAGAPPGGFGERFRPGGSYWRADPDPSIA